MSWIKPYVHRRKKPVEQMGSSLSQMEFQEEPQSQETFSQMEFEEEPESQQFDMTFGGLSDGKLIYIWIWINT